MCSAGADQIMFLSIKGFLKDISFVNSNIVFLCLLVFPKDKKVKAMTKLSDYLFNSSISVKMRYMSRLYPLLTSLI